MGTKIDVKDKIDGDTMDLSFLELTEVPMKDMASYKKVKAIDLSTNKLVRLPVSFVTLTHLVKLDLSKNQLKELPENFGQMRKLRHLDLFNNQLKQLPLSFCELRDLRFLDLKDNPLVPVLKDAAGDCVDSRSCQLAAKRVVELMGNLKVEVDKQLQKEKEKKEREERERKEAEQAILEEMRRQKRADKERRRIEAQKLRTRENGNEPLLEDSGFQEPPQYYERPIPTHSGNEKGNTLLGLASGMIFTVALTTLVCFLGILLARWSGPVTSENLAANLKSSYTASWDLFQNAVLEATTIAKEIGNKLRKFANSQYLDRIIEKGFVIWDVVSVKVYELLSYSYQAGVRGVGLIWKEGGDLFRWLLEQLPKWKSEILSKVM